MNTKANTAEIHNENDNVTALVFLSEHFPGRYGVSLRDDDSGEYISGTKHGMTYETAMAYAKKIAGV